VKIGERLRLGREKFKSAYGKRGRIRTRSCKLEGTKWGHKPFGIKGKRNGRDIHFGFKVTVKKNFNPKKKKLRCDLKEKRKEKVLVYSCLDEFPETLWKGFPADSHRNRSREAGERKASQFVRKTFLHGRKRKFFPISKSTPLQDLTVKNRRVSQTYTFL